MSDQGSFTMDRIFNPPSARPDRRFISAKIHYGRCSSCREMYSAEKVVVGMAHKDCPCSPKGRYRKA